MQYQVHTEPVLPTVSFSWFEPLAEPVRVKRGLRAGAQMFEPTVDPTPKVSFGWFDNLSEPVRGRKLGLRAHLQQAFTADTTVIPLSRIFWFQPLSEPLHAKSGLHAARQQFLASPSRLLPTPTSFGVFDATETKDTMLAGAMVFNRPTDAEIGVINTTPQPAEIGVAQAAPTAGTIFCKISIIIGP